MIYTNGGFRHKKTVFYADDGGFRTTHENDDPDDMIYYLGIIDCLTHVSTLRILLPSCKCANLS